MSVELKRLLLAKCHIFHWIAKIINYKKLSKANVTYYATKRLDNLKTQWGKARRLRIDIEIEATEENRKTLPYFIQDHYSKAEEVYEGSGGFSCQCVG